MWIYAITRIPHFSGCVKGYFSRKHWPRGNRHWGPGPIAASGGRFGGGGEDARVGQVGDVQGDNLVMADREEDGVAPDGDGALMNGAL